MSAPRRRRGGTGPITRVLLGLQVGFSLLLAALVAFLVVWVLQRPTLHLRWDLTRDRSASLDPAAAGLIAQMPEPVRIDIFFQGARSLARHQYQAYTEAMSLMRGLLYVAQNQAPARLKVVDHDLQDLVRARERLHELGVREETNIVVVSRPSGPRTVLRLTPDLCDLARIDQGPGLPPVMQLTSFRGEQALVDALLKISQESAPKVLFAAGHGERDNQSAEARALGLVRDALLKDGFEVDLWDSTREPRIPADCDVLAIVDPRQPYSPEEVESIEAFLSAGGRALITAQYADYLEGAGSVSDLLARYGILVRRGVICRPLLGPGGEERYGDARCGELPIGREGLDPRSPITKPLWDANYTVQMPLSHSFDRGSVPPGGSLITLVRSQPRAWRDLVGTEPWGDWVPDRNLERRDAYSLCMAVEKPSGSGPGAGEAGEGRSTRIVAVGASDALCNAAFRFNRDLVLNAFNWLASRESRVKVGARDPIQRTLDVRGGRELVRLRWLAVGILPGLCLLLGLFTWYRRRR